MSRNSSGVYTLPNAPVVTNTTITSTDENTTRSDIASEITNSLDRNGRGAMLAPLQLADGTPSLPGLTFGTNTNTGMYRIGANIIGFAVAGALALTIAAGGLTVATSLGIGLTPGRTFDVLGPSGATTARIVRNDAGVVGNLILELQNGSGGGTTVASVDSTGKGIFSGPLVAPYFQATGVVSAVGTISFESNFLVLQGGTAGFQIRDSGDANTNLQVSDAGVATFRTSVITPLLTSAASLLIQTPGGGNFEFSSGTGVIRANSDNTHVFGDNTHRWNTLYTFNVDSGSGASLFLRTGNGNTSFEVIQAGAGAVNWWGASGQATGITPFLGVRGETNITGVLQGLKGTGTFRINEAVNNTTQFEVLSVPTAARWITVTASIAGNPTLAVTAGNLAITAPAVIVSGNTFEIGTNPSQSAGYNTPYTSGLNSRNGANNGDINVVFTLTVNSVADIIEIGSSVDGGVILHARTKAGPPTTTDLTAGLWAVWRDTTAGTTKVYYNNAGAIIASAAFT